MLRLPQQRNRLGRLTGALTAAIWDRERWAREVGRRLGRDAERILTEGEQRGAGRTGGTVEAEREYGPDGTPALPRCARRLPGRTIGEGLGTMGGSPLGAIDASGCGSTLCLRHMHLIPSLPLLGLPVFA